jgi:hypothetical protein
MSKDSLIPDVRLDIFALTGKSPVKGAGGEPVDIARHQPAVEVHAATYTEFRVPQDPMVNGLHRAWWMF